MPEKENLTVTRCPGCASSMGGSGRVLRYSARFKDPISLHGDFENCPMCEGSGLVFVIPARVIGPAQR